MRWAPHRRWARAGLSGGRGLVLAALCWVMACTEAAAPAATSDTSSTEAQDIRADGGPLPDLAILPAEDTRDAPAEAVADFGQPCVQNTDCSAGYCVLTRAGTVCSQPCFDACPGDFVCRQVAAGGLDVAFACVPRAANVCDACFSDTQCFGGRCAALAGDGDARFCLAPCDPAAQPSDCAAGSTCTTLDAVALCVPDTASCTCGPDTLGAQRPCKQSSDFGVCNGVETCDSAGWGACSAPLPVAETCDGVDQDCNGVADDGLSAPACALTQGVCAGATATCGGALGWLACDASRYGADYQVVETACDGKDNDCNGLTDDVDVDHDGHAPIACGGDDCDDLNSVVHPGHVEVCGDGLDNDCSKSAEDRDIDQDGHIAAACGGDDCNDEAKSAAPGLVEVCGDGLDNDCSGGIDNLDADGDGFVALACGGKDCDDGRADTYPGAPELCNLVDDDCDGVTDEKDADSDGAIDVACGGDDCDDERAEVRPGVLEICGDDLDNDCSGVLNDRDRDGDGHVDLACGGDDCDDGDPLVYPTAQELYDTKDSDCDGFVDEFLVGTGALVITEVSLDRKWLELTNLGVLPVNLATMTLQGNDGLRGMLPAAPPVLVAPGAAAVLCVDTNPATNGGVPCAVGVPWLSVGPKLLVDLAGVVIDSINLASAGFPAPQAGASLSLDPNQYNVNANKVGGNWCVAPPSALLPSGDRGSPGAPNPSCSGAPAVIAVTPSSGVDNGGEVVLLAGSGFIGVSTVTVGGAPCANFTIVSDTQIRCTTPAGNAGAVDVTVVKGAAVAVGKAAYTYTGEAVTVVDWCDIQFPTGVSAVSGQSSGVLYGRVHSTNPANDFSGAPAGVGGQVGVGPKGADPRNDPGWLWFPATWNPTCGGEPCGPNDEFYGVVKALGPAGGLDAGSYALAYRFSDDGGVNFMYCDLLPGTADGFSPSKLATLTVTAP